MMFSLLVLFESFPLCPTLFNRWGLPVWIDRGDCHCVDLHMLHHQSVQEAYSSAMNLEQNSIDAQIHMGRTNVLTAEKWSGHYSIHQNCLCLAAAPSHMSPLLGH